MIMNKKTFQITLILYAFVQYFSVGVMMENFISVIHEKLIKSQVYTFHYKQFFTCRDILSNRLRQL